MISSPSTPSLNVVISLASFMPISSPVMLKMTTLNAVTSTPNLKLSSNNSPLGVSAYSSAAVTKIVNSSTSIVNNSKSLVPLKLKAGSNTYVNLYPKILITMSMNVVTSSPSMISLPKNYPNNLSLPPVTLDLLTTGYLLHYYRIRIIYPYHLRGFC